MLRFLVRFALNAVAVWLTAQIVPGVTVQGAGGAALAVLIIALVNAFIRPVVSLLTLPLQFITLGLFTLVVNALMFWLAGALGASFGAGFAVSGFWAGFFGAVVMTLISWGLSVLLPEPDK
ncbi:MAG: phage holin family protein [Chloroflexi bacterium]|nr:phage holin family protein [Chloroflexota bacterium]